MKEDEMGEACRAYGRKRKCVRVWLKNLEDQDVDGRITFKQISKKI
jgi:hypothetical protein